MAINRRSFLAAAVALSGARPAGAVSERAFDVATPDGAPVRNFAIPHALAPSDLPGLSTHGPAAATTVLYEFFDYACSYCRNAAQELDVLLGPDAGFRLALVHFPILSRPSAEAARIVLAATHLWGNEATYRLHKGLYETPGRPSAGKALDIASGLKMDAAALSRAAASDETSAILQAHMDRAHALALRYTPSFVLGDFAFVGWPGAETMQSFLDASRACGGLACKDKP
ncbi:MAG: DsbA family protein [Hyphomicrobiales bacterium]|nr:DsbA family protein [Hyphomicrobiales bacterium]